MAKFQNILPISLKALTEVQGHGWPMDAHSLTMPCALQPSIHSETAMTIDKCTFCLELFERLCRLCGEQKVMNSLTTPPSFWFVFQNESSENLQSLESRS